MADLKPCPFCGSTDIYETYTEEYSGIKNPEIFCNSCKVIFSIEDDSPYMNCDDDYKYRKEKTKEAWNKRAQPEIIRCEDCKHRILNENYGKKGYMNLKAMCELDTGDPFELGRNAEDDDWFCGDAERKES